MITVAWEITMKMMVTMTVTVTLTMGMKMVIIERDERNYVGLTSFKTRHPTSN